MKQFLQCVDVGYVAMCNHQEKVSIVKEGKGYEFYTETELSVLDNYDTVFEIPKEARIYDVVDEARRYKEKYKL